MPSIDFQAWDLLGLFVFALIGAAVSFFNIKRKGTPLLLSGPSPVQVDAEKKQAVEEQKAQDQRDQKVEQATEEHDTVVKNQVKQLEKTTTEVENDVKKTNDVLLDISRQMRS